MSFVLLLLLLLALAATVTVGALLLLRNLPGPPPPFGFANPCGVPFHTGDILSFNTRMRSAGADDGYQVLHSSGSLYSGPQVTASTAGEDVSRSEYVESATYRERTLTQRGMRFLSERIERLDLGPGCVTVQTHASRGGVFVRTEDGISGVTWYPYEGIYGTRRRATQVEEATLADLALDLNHLDAWLPPEAWLEAEEQRVVPDRWLVFLTLNDAIRRSTAYEAVTLPGGVDPAVFGEQMDVDPLALEEADVSRCAVVGRGEAVAVAQSVDAAQAGAWIDLRPAFPDGVDCDWLAAETVASDHEPEATPSMDGEFASLDACLLTGDAASALGMQSPQLNAGPFLSPLGTWDPGCNIFDPATGVQAIVQVHSRPVAQADARDIAIRLLGGTTAEQHEAIAGHPAWVNDCADGMRQCWFAVAVSMEPYFISIAIDTRGLVASPDVRAFVDVVLHSIESGIART